MNIAKSDDNTYAITDLSLEDLAALWHLSNRAQGKSLDQYVATSLGKPDELPDYMLPDVVAELGKCTRADLIRADEELYFALNDYLTNDLIEAEPTLPSGELITITGENEDILPRVAVVDQDGNVILTDGTVLRRIPPRAVEKTYKKKGSNRGKK